MHADRNTAITLAAILTVWGFGSLIAAKGVFSQETAAWVQAIGAIVAIIAAGRAAQLPIQAAARKAAEDRNREITEIAVAMVDAQIMFASLRDALLAGDNNSIAQAYFDFREKGDGDAALRSWLTLPARDWPNVSIYVLAHRLVSEIDAFRSIKQLTPKIKTFEDHLAHIDDAAMKLNSELLKAREH